MVGSFDVDAGDVGTDIAQRLGAACRSWNWNSVVLCYSMTPEKRRGNVYKTVLTSATLHWAETRGTQTVQDDHEAWLD